MAASCSNLMRKRPRMCERTVTEMFPLRKVQQQSTISIQIHSIAHTQSVSMLVGGGYGNSGSDLTCGSGSNGPGDVHWSLCPLIDRRSRFADMLNEPNAKTATKYPPEIYENTIERYGQKHGVVGSAPLYKPESCSATLTANKHRGLAGGTYTFIIARPAIKLKKPREAPHKCHMSPQTRYPKFFRLFVIQNSQFW